MQITPQFQQVDDATEAMQQLYLPGGHPLDWWIGDTIPGDITPDVQPFVLGIDLPRIRHAFHLVMFYGHRIVNLFVLGFWI
ncbi:MAG: hypothetical protein RI947_1598 [Candidatus Parcubacteria bacterium]|jgi:hypothetical protein